ncbi:hypothetical protein SANBI_002481 [Sanguibacter sp. 4.1]|uniref:Uncharacterized protein n=1 Tax=Sanguibacter biliveldensis TaxID=3030830 RepID=A0AAF0Z1H2_9MICO|nr:hypothetical protein [Sanguibacter sp. 4.1]WPF81203.1 hypothetical protein SANBI_002481 [Sanguibacter sp. 4.1]
MKSPRDASMVVAAIVSAALVVGLASITSGGAVASLARSADTETTVQVDETVTATPESTAPSAEAKEPSPSTVTVDPDATVEATGSELSATDVVTPSDVHTSRADAQALADQVGEETGRTVVLVFQEKTVDGRSTTWTHTEIPGRAPFVASEEDVLVSRVTEWIDAQKDPEAFELIVDE